MGASRTTAFIVVSMVLAGVAGFVIAGAAGAGVMVAVTPFMLVALWLLATGLSKF